MTIKSFPVKYVILAVFIGAIFFALVFFYGAFLSEKIIQYYNFFTDREQIKVFITSFGSTAPIAFIIIQIFQVLFAPIPGEVAGFIGGYLFGVAKGFLYSTIGLTGGSLINFIIGRFLGKHYVRKLIPAKQLDMLDAIIKRQGVIVLFILFVFPGFPKDYLCLFLGLSDISFKIFFILVFIGRMPGTFMLSLQGASLCEQTYGLFFLVVGISLVCIFFAYRYREVLYGRLEK